MRLGTKSIEEQLAIGIEERKEQKKENVHISLPAWLMEKSGEIIDAVLEFDVATRSEIKTVLCLRHPETGVEPEAHELKQYLTDLPFFAMAVHDAYLGARNYREDLKTIYEREEHILMADHEDKVKKEWFEEYDAGHRQKMGVVSKNQIERSMAQDFNARKKLGELRKKLQQAQTLEERLEKMVHLLDRRSHEIQTILKVEAGLNR